MFRQIVVILVAVAVLMAAGVLAMSALGWWPPRSALAPTPSNPAPSNPAPSTPAPGQPEAAQPAPAPKPLPTAPAQPLSTPDPELPTESSPSKPLPKLAPVPPVPQVEVIPPRPVARAAPAPPTPEVALAPAPTPQTIPALPPAQPTGTSLDALNRVRALAGVPPVKAESRWQAECLAHATYLAVTDTGSHSEDPQNPHYSASGANCAPGHYYVTMRPEATAAQAMAYWQAGPFHLPQMLDPRLTRAAFALAHDAAGDIRTAAVLDLKRGRSGNARYPVQFPAPGETVPPRALSQYEFPDALPGCPGFEHPVGAPIALLQGAGKTASAVSLKVNGQAVVTCLLTAENFRGGSEGDTRSGRSVLAAQGVAVALPRRPLPAGARVEVKFQTLAGPVAWNFSTQ